MVKRWIALFSQTGSEIYNIAQTFGKYPDIIISNTYEVTEKLIDPRLMGDTKIICNDHRSIVERLIETPNSFITLHGYLKILPASVCSAHTIYNGHPGLITLYPDLKGKDPQEKVWQNLSKYTRIGSVVHQCVPEVDSGRVEEIVSVPNTCQTKEDVYRTLRDTSFKCWINFLEGRVL